MASAAMSRTIFPKTEPQSILCIHFLFGISQKIEDRVGPVTGTFLSWSRISMKRLCNMFLIIGALVCRQQVEYKDDRIKTENWTNLKTTLPFGQVSLPNMKQFC
jgi:hypothetical protein